MHPPLRLLSAVLVPVLIVIGAVFSVAIADTVRVWKWRDANGQVVYSQQPPPGKVKAEEKHIDPNRNVIESGWPPPAPTVSASGSGPSAEERSTRRSRGRIARQGGGAATDEVSVPPAVAPAPPPVPPPAIVAPPVPPPPPIFPSPGPGGS